MVDDHWPTKGYLLCYKDPSDIDFMFFVKGLENNHCFIYFKCLVVLAIFIASSTPNVLPMTAIMKLDKTNYQKWKNTSVINMKFMKLDLALEIDSLEKPTYKSKATIKKLHEDWKYSNKCCMMMMENCMDEVVYASIPKVDTTKGLLKEIGKKFIKFDMNEKHHYLYLLNNTKYDGVKGVRDHIMLLSSYCNKLKSLKMDIGEVFMTYSIMKSLPS